MARRPDPNKRIEPSFDTPARPGKPGGLRVDDRDRAVASRKKKPKKPAKSGAKRRKTAKKPRSTSRFSLFSFIGNSIYWCFVLGLWGGIGVAGLVGYYAAKLPSSDQWRIPDRPPNARIVSLDGSLIANRGATGGAAMRLSEMSPYIPMAVIAIEDHRFNSHFGFDPVGFSRAMLTNLKARRLVQGGSTLTQQLAKNLFTEAERTLERKVQELILAVWLESKYSKDEILELYLNRVYFGSNSYGVDAAARRYFGKSARDVNLAEAATLAGLLKAPSRLSPARNPQGAAERAKLVLSAMLREDFITTEEAKRAKQTKAKKAKRYWSGAEHYVADLVLDEIRDILGEIPEDIVVDTTIDPGLQEYADELISETLKENGEKRKVSEGAMVAMSPYGAVRALVGGREYADSQFNRATEAKRQPGSAFKPIVYLAALEAGRTPESIRRDAPVRIGKWKPENYDRKYRGPVTLRTALSKSLNTIAAQLAVEVGPKTVVETAKRLGIRSKLAPNASIALGTSEVTLMELASAYAPFANGGRLARPFLVRRIKDMDGNLIYERKLSETPQVVRAREVGMINDMMMDVVANGTGKAAQLGKREVAGKTGTSQKSRDALFVGYTADLVTAVWFGNDDGSPTRKVTGGSLPAQTWGKFMKRAHDDLPLAELPGNYEPVVAALPISRDSTGSVPSSSGSRNQPSRSIRDVIDDESGGATTPRRRSLSEIQNGPRPRSEVGAQASEERRKPRTILDLLFGRD